MPYQIGQKVYAVHFKHRSATLQQFFYTQPFLVTDETPQVIKFLELQVVTRHTVRSLSEDRTKEPSHKGFVLRDQEGNLFACQYPHAAYGIVEREDYNRFNIHADGDALAEWLAKNPYDYYYLDACMEKLREMIAAVSPDSAVATDASRLKNHDRYLAMVNFHNRIIREFVEQFPAEAIRKFDLITPKEKQDVYIAPTECPQRIEREPPAQTGELVGATVAAMGI